MPLAPGFQRHVLACNNAELPGRRVPFRVEGQTVGWVLPETAALVGVAALASDLPAIGAALVQAGLCRNRRELFDVRAEPNGPVLGAIDRGALPILGIEAVGIHLNGLVRRTDGLHMWIGRRAMDKQLDPGKLDHIVGGGVSAGLSPDETLLKEGAEEAGLPAELAAQAVHRGVIAYAMDRPEGLRRDRLHCYDLMLPDGFVPQPVDGEVTGFELWPIARVVATVHNTDAFKFNVNLVLIDLFQRFGLIAS